MEHRQFKDQLNEQFVRISKAVANPHRFELLDILAQGERSVEELAQESHLTIANTSQHLQVLRGVRLVQMRKVGLYVYYSLADPAIFRLVQIIREIATQQLSEINELVDDFLSSRQNLEPISMDELRTRLNDPALVILDVRPSVEYAQGHIAGARSIPVDELATRLDELSPTQTIIAYCRGTYCVFADEAVDLLLARGYRAQRLQDGYPAWQLAGFPI